MLLLRAEGTAAPIEETNDVVASLGHDREELLPTRDVLIDVMATIDAASCMAASKSKPFTVPLMETSTGILTRRND